MPLSKVGAAMNITSGQMQQLQKEAVRTVKCSSKSFFLFKKCLIIKVNVGWRSSPILYRYANINKFHFTTLHIISQHYIAFHITALHSRSLHHISQHYIVFHISTLHFTTLHRIILHIMLYFITTFFATSFCALTLLRQRSVEWQ